MKLSSEDQEALRCAKALLENPGLAAKITGLIGMPIEKALKLLPEKWAKVVNEATRKSLETALQAALLTLDDKPQANSWEFLHKLAVAATGAGGAPSDCWVSQSNCPYPPPSCCAPLLISHEVRVNVSGRRAPNWPALRSSLLVGGARATTRVNPRTS